MAKLALYATVGSLVYEAFRPQKPGKVVSIRPSNRPHHDDYLTVKFEDGSTQEFSRGRLNDFEALIDDHKRKYLKFDAIASKLRTI